MHTSQGPLTLYLRTDVTCLKSHEAILAAAEKAEQDRDQIVGGPVFPSSRDTIIFEVDDQRYLKYIDCPSGEYAIIRLPRDASAKPTMDDFDVDIVIASEGFPLVDQLSRYIMAGIVYQCSRWQHESSENDLPTIDQHRAPEYTQGRE